MKILVTGAAGFIGMHVAERLLADGHDVVGLDNLNDYYDVSLKQARLARLTPHANFGFFEIDLADDAEMAKLFAESSFSAVVHLGAQAGVRYSLSHPHVYVDSNVRGTLNVLEGCRRQGIAHLVFASTSSVYGLNTKMPFSPHDGVDHPVSLYASTKRAGELMGHNYAELFGVPFTALRFFTVYGPWGRPDMSPTLFASRILAGEPVNIFNGGKHTRDFTYIDDIVEAICRVIHIPAVADARWNARYPDPASSRAPFRVYNIGRGQPVELLHFVELLGRALGREVKKNFLPMQPGDVEDTEADVVDLEQVTKFRPLVSIEEGVERFARWFAVEGRRWAVG